MPPRFLPPMFEGVAIVCFLVQTAPVCFSDPWGLFIHGVTECRQCAIEIMQTKDNDIMGAAVVELRQL